jgi:hypothetical protein
VKIFDDIEINHSHFNYFIVFICFLLVYAAMSFGDALLPGVIGNAASIGMNLSTFLVASFGFQFFLLGPSRNIPAEIFDENNQAAAIYVGAIFIAIALVIRGGG